jgi:diacylglycerol O-acyltransferase
VDRMNETEAIMWAVEAEPMFRSDFANLVILDGQPDEARIRSKVQRAIAAIPRMRERVVDAPFDLAPPMWIEDPEFDADYHLRKVAVPAPGDRRALLDLVGTLIATPLDRSRPLWEFTLIEGLADGTTALLQQVHHTITDGVGGLKLSVELLDLTPDPPASELAHAGEHVDASLNTHESAHEFAHEYVAPLPSALANVWSTGNWFVTEAQRGLGALARGLVARVHHPQQIPHDVRIAAQLAASLQRQVFITDTARSPLMKQRSLARYIDIASFPIDDAKSVSRKLGGTLNDFFVTAVAGALGTYYADMGIDVDELRMSMPISTRGSRVSSTENAFAPARVLVPTRHDCRTRFLDIHDRLQGVRQELAVEAAGSLAGLFAALPDVAIVAIMRQQANTIDFATSNLRGSPIPLYAGGCKIVGSYPIGPRSGCAVNATLLSYEDQCMIGFNIDPYIVTHPEHFMECFRTEVAALYAL